MENTVQVPMAITDDVQADEALEQIRDIRAEANRLEMIANARIKNIQQQLNAKLDTLTNTEQMLMDQLKAYSLEVKFKETKTLKKYKLVSGELIIKKPTVKIAHDDTKILEYLQSKGDETYIKNVPKLDWAAMKKDLDIDGDSIINEATGEILADIDGLSVQEVGEIFDIKI